MGSTVEFERLPYGLKIDGQIICDLHYAKPLCSDKIVKDQVNFNENVFTSIYNSNGWGKASKSGTSDANSTVSLRTNLQSFIKQYNILSILDAPCGDNAYMSLLDLTGIQYLGVDIVKENIKKNRERYPTKYYLNQMIENLPEATFDLVVSRALLQHLCLSDGMRILNSTLLRSGKYILLTTFLTGDNRDIINGEHYFINIFKKPFCFNEPIVLFPDFNLQRGDKNLMYAGIWEVSKIKHCMNLTNSSNINNSL
eukprot:TRINITY_DN1048_c0_g1_i5.p1 TRINITY_DN1048_c0_g1~~TRINITY_DN1048_c0_g1_i5.p1  ORF type:complete len:254 (-),score=11.89 TRINITY_DN1048_c0_g1_i5:570-1331(-)